MDKSNQVRFDQATANIEPSQAALAKPVLTSHPAKIEVNRPESAVAIERHHQRINVEVFSTTQEIMQPPLTNIRTERPLVDRVESVHIEPLRKPLNKASVQKPMALNLARLDDERMQVDEPYVVLMRRQEEEQRVEAVQVQPPLNASKIEEKRVSVLNAPMFVDEHVPGIEVLPTVVSRPPVIAHEMHEFVTHEVLNEQQLSSTLVIPLENLKELPTERPSTQTASFTNEYSSYLNNNPI